MKNTVRAGVVWCLAYLSGRGLLVIRYHARHACWGVSLLVTSAFLFALTEIVWSKREFESLEEVVANLVATKNREAVRRWYRKVVERMYRSRLSVITGLCFLPLLLGVVYVLDWNSWLQPPALRRYETLCQMLMMIAMAASQWPYANISTFIWRLPRKQLYINFYAHPRDSIMSVGSLLLKIDLGGLTLISIMAVALHEAPVHVPVFVTVLLISAYLWAGAWFFLTQYALHICMVDQKRQKLRVVSRRLMLLLDELTADATPDKHESFNAQKRLHAELDALPEWPFRTQTVITLASGVFIPLTLGLLNLAMRR
jgi:hypothetical protein